MDQKIQSSFPLDALPRDIQLVCKELHDSYQFAIDYSACAVLSAVSTGIGNTMRVELKPGYNQPGILFLAFVGKPGSNKSAPINFFYKKFYETDNESQKPTDKSSLVSNRLQTMVNDTTIEGIIALHADNPKGLCLHADELLGWINSYGRYNKGSDEQTWLTIYNGGPIRITRKNADLDVSIPYTYVNVIGTIQTDILHKLIDADKLQNGFVDRILFAYPMVKKALRWTDKDADLQILAIWNNVIASLMRQKVSHNGPIIIKYAQDAYKYLLNWQNTIADQDDCIDNDTIKGLHAKLETYVIRFCLILHTLNCICNGSDLTTKITIDIVKKSIMLYNYFDHTAKKVRAISTINSMTSQYETLYDSLPNVFSTSDALALAERIHLTQRSIYRFLNKNDGLLFTKTQRGRYKKITK